MPKNRAQGGRVIGGSATKEHARTERGQRVSQGALVRQSPTQRERPDLGDPTPEPRHQSKIYGDWHKSTEAQSPSEVSRTRNSEGVLKSSENDGFSTSVSRPATAAATSPAANRLRDISRTSRGSGHQARGVYGASSENGTRGESRIYVSHTPTPTTLSTEATGSAAVGGRENRNETPKVAHEASWQVQQDLGRAKAAMSRVEAFKELPEPIASFVVKVAVEDAVGCAEFLNKRPDTVNEPFVASTLRQAAIASIGAEDTYVTDSCVNALAVISFCLSSTRTEATKLFTTMLLKDDDEIIQKFNQIIKDEKEICLALSARRFDSGQSTELVPQGGQFSGSESSRKRKEEGNAFENLHKLPRVSRRLDLQDTIRAKFQRREPAFFQRGSMFATVEHEFLPEFVFAGLPGLRTTSQSHHGVISKILYYVSVKPGDNYCLALQAKIYGGLGLSRKPNIASSIESHAIIYNTIPRLQRGEPELRKQAVKVDLATGVPDLDPAMRLDFGRVYTVEYTVRAQEVGKVVETDQLVRTWTRQMGER